LLYALHARWVSLLEQMTDSDYNRKLFHPDKNKEVSLWEMLAEYDWHCRHHLAHILHAKEQYLNKK
ncbi:MAG: DinB family protein, partial [Chitinophagaceae bacterium]